MSHPAGDTGRLRRRPVVVAVVAALAVGLLLGGLVAGSADGGPGGGEAASTSDPEAPPSAGPGDAAVQIDEACLRAFDAARQALDSPDGVGRALADLDAARLDEVIHRLQPLEQQLRQGAADCEVAALVPDRSGDPAPPPAASPSASPGG